MRITILILLAAISFTACQNNSAESEAASAETTTTEAVVEKKYSLEPFAETYEFPDADLQSMKYENGQFDFGFTGYQLGQQTPDADAKMCANSAKGSHIHLIANTQPYIAKYEGSFAQELPDGDHKLLAFLSRSYHESIKNGKAYIAQNVSIANNTITEASDISDPMLFYSRPKGTYVGKANTDKVMLDFYLVNTDLGSNYKVKALINEEEHMIDTWQPYLISGLPMGENIVTLTLVDANGEKVDTPLNPVSRKFTLKEDPTENLN